MCVWYFTLRVENDVGDMEALNSNLINDQDCRWVMTLGFLASFTIVFQAHTTFARKMPLEDRIQRLSETLSLQIGKAQEVDSLKEFPKAIETLELVAAQVTPLAKWGALRGIRVGTMTEASASAVSHDLWITVPWNGTRDVIFNILTEAGKKATQVQTVWTQASNELDRLGGSLEPVQIAVDDWSIGIQKLVQALKAVPTLREHPFSIRMSQDNEGWNTESTLVISWKASTKEMTEAVKMFFDVESARWRAQEKTLAHQLGVQIARPEPIPVSEYTKFLDELENTAQDEQVSKTIRRLEVRPMTHPWGDRIIRTLRGPVSIPVTLKAPAIGILLSASDLSEIPRESHFVER